MRVHDEFRVLAAIGREVFWDVATKAPSPLAGEGRGEGSDKLARTAGFEPAASTFGRSRASIAPRAYGWGDLPDSHRHSRIHGPVCCCYTKISIERDLHRTGISIELAVQAGFEPARLALTARRSPG